MSFHNRIFRIYSILIGLILLGVGLVLAQIFPIFIERTTSTSIDGKIEDIESYISTTNITSEERQEIINHLNASLLEEDVNFIQMNLWIALAFILILAYLIALIISFNIMKRYSQPVEHLTETAMELARGNYRIRAFEDGFSGMSKLTNSINILARNLQDISIMR
ncbi:MAG: hypothetical protein ABS939_22500, partial [Psychrobacillus sp.]